MREDKKMTHLIVHDFVTPTRMEHLLKDAYEKESREIRLFNERKDGIGTFVPIEYSQDKGYLIRYATRVAGDIRGGYFSSVYC